MSSLPNDTLVVNMSDPMTDVRANSQRTLQQMQDAAREQLAEVQRKAAERQKLVEAEQAKLKQARAAKEKATNGKLKPIHDHPAA